LPDPDAIQTFEFEWHVVTPDQLPEGDWVLFSLTPKGYENLSLTFADTLRWIREARHRLDYYRENLNDPEQEQPDG